jgi:hypothetical protein
MILILHSLISRLSPYHDLPKQYFVCDLENVDLLDSEAACTCQDVVFLAADLVVQDVNSLREPVSSNSSGNSSLLAQMHAMHAVAAAV